jgi:hypothetical protein
MTSSARDSLAARDPVGGWRVVPERFRLVESLLYPMHIVRAIDSTGTVLPGDVGVAWRAEASGAQLVDTSAAGRTTVVIVSYRNGAPGVSPAGADSLQRGWFPIERIGCRP